MEELENVFVATIWPGGSTQYYSVLLRPTQYYSPYYSVLQSTTRYSVRRQLGDAKQNVTATFMIAFAGHWNVQYNARSNSWNWTQNLRFAKVSRGLPTESCEKVHPGKSKCAFRYSGVQSKISKCTFRYSGVHKDVWNKWAMSAAARGIQKSSYFKVFYHSFGRPTSTKWRKGCTAAQKNAHFTTVLSVRRARSDEKVARTTQEICISPQFWTSDEHEVTRMSPHWVCQTYPAEKKIKEEQHFGRAAFLSAAFLSSSSQQLFSQQLFSAAFLSNSSQQPFSAALLSSSSQQPFSAAFLCSFSQQAFPAALLSSLSQQLFSAAFLSSPSQQLFSAAFLRSFSQQLFSAAFLSSFSQQPCSATFLSSHPQLSSCCGQGLVVSY